MPDSLTLFPADPPTPAPKAPAGPFASIAIERSLDRVLDYAIPPALLSNLRVGQRVRVPLGRGNKPTTGYIVDIHPTTATTAKIKSILSIDDDRALVTPALMQLSRWISSYYCCPLGTVLESVIPAAVKNKIGLEYTPMVRLAQPREKLQEILEKTKAPKRRAILARLLQLKDDESIDLLHLATQSNSTPATVRKLAKLSLITITPEPEYRSLDQPTAPPQSAVGNGQSATLNPNPQTLTPPLPLNPDQQSAFSTLLPRLTAGFSVNLLYGVTGSGKTELYLRCIKELVDRGRRAIVLVPEIALTPQTVQRFTARFPRVAILHSGLVASARHRFWQQIAQGQADVVVGARSAIFAPVPDLGIIVIDEEHESSYKQDTAPRYHARDIAIKRAQLENIPILLGSATPSLEMWHKCRPALSDPRRVCFSTPQSETTPPPETPPPTCGQNPAPLSFPLPGTPARAQGEGLPPTSCATGSSSASAGLGATGSLSASAASGATGSSSASAPPQPSVPLSARPVTPALSSPRPGTPARGQGEGSSADDLCPDAVPTDSRPQHQTQSPNPNPPTPSPTHHLLTLPHRVRGLQLPAVELVDMRREMAIHRPGIHLISKRLEALLHSTLHDGHQAILLLNRRGYSNFVYCPSCSHLMTCKYCDVTLTYHRSAGMHTTSAKFDEGKHTGQLHCHYCLAVNPLPDSCPECKKKLTLFGLGTQRVEEELIKKFPNLKFARVDSDTMRSARDYEAILGQFARREIQVMLGTQMIAKGLDYPNVTLVGVISGDTALSLPDFRAAERTFQLITQVAGRAGRGDAPGRVILQTFLPDDPTIQAAIKQDFVGFAESELRLRREVGLPPLQRMVRIILRDENLDTLHTLSAKLATAISQAIANETGHTPPPTTHPAPTTLPFHSPDPSTLDPKPSPLPPITMKGPMPCAINRIAGHHRMQLLLFSPSPTLLQRILAKARQANAFSLSDRIAVDVDPVSLL